MLKTASDGYIGNLSKGEILLEVFVDKDKDIYGYDVSGHGLDANLVLKKDKSVASDASNAKRYCSRMRINKGDTGAYTSGNENTMRLIQLWDGNRVSVWELAVIAQFGKFFLTIQKTSDFRCFCYEDVLVCPGISKWQRMVNLVNTLWFDKRDYIPPVEDYVEDQQEPSCPLEPLSAEVLWFNYARGIGALRTNYGDARVHWKQVPRRSRRAFLIEGELVRYRRLVAPDKELKHPTTFKLEAQRVRLLND